MMRPSRISALLCLSLLLAVSGRSQTANEEKKPDYSQEAFVIEKAVTRIVFENDGTRSQQVVLRARVQSEAALPHFGLIRLGYQGANETATIEYIRVQKPDGTVVETPLDTVQDIPAEITRTAPMYSDLREKHVAVKGLSVGDVVEFSLRTQLTTPPIPNHFWADYSFDRKSIVLDEQLQIDVPRDRALKLKSPELQATITETGKRRVYTWKAANLERKKADKKQEAVEDEDEGAPRVQLTTFQSWEEVGQWYGALQRPRVEVTPEIRARAQELTRGATSEEDKARALYNYVSSRFRYISLSFGIGRYQPHSAGEVLSNQYGDCKDKHTLLAALMKAAGLAASPALIHSTRKLDAEIPSPGQFDHLISVAALGNTLFWLDTTPEVAPFGMLLAGLRDKDALYIPENGPARLEHTLADPPFPWFHRFRLEGKLSAKGTLEGKVQTSVRGDPEVILRAAFRNTSPAQWSQLVQNIIRIWGFAGTVSEVSVSPLEATEAPLELRYAYTRENYSDWENGRIAPPLPFVVLSLPGVPDEGTPAAGKPIELGPSGEVLYQARVELPSNFAPRLPPSTEIHEDFGDYQASYRLADGVLEVERHLTIKQREVPAERRSAYRAFRKGVSREGDTYLSESTSYAALDQTDNEEAQRAFNEGRVAFQQRQLRRARESFERAVALDPSFAGAWLALGDLRMSAGEREGGLDAFRKAREANPKHPATHASLALALRWLGRTDEALEAWRGLRALDPQDRSAPANIGSILFEKKLYAEAVPELEAAVKLDPRSWNAQYQLGQAYLRVNEPEKAVRAFEGALELESSPGMLNNVAYELADRGVQLPQALDYAQRAVRGNEEETAKIQVDKVEDADLVRMRSLAAAWDTLGWAHFRLNNLTEAEKHLVAAWNLSQDAPIADHLGQLYEKQGKKADAAKAYAWEVAAGNEMQLKDVRERLRKQLGSEARADSAVMRARSELSLMRTIKLPRVTPGKASAEFFVVLSAGKVDGVKFISGSEELRGAAEALTSAKHGALFPDDAPTKIVRRGILYCMESSSQCDFVHVPLPPPPPFFRLD